MAAYEENWLSLEETAPATEHLVLPAASEAGGVLRNRTGNKAKTGIFITATGFSGEARTTRLTGFRYVVLRINLKANRG